MAGKWFLPFWVFLFVARYMYICVYILFIFELGLLIHFVLEFPYKGILISPNIFCLWNYYDSWTLKELKEQPQMHSIIKDLLWRNLPTTSQERAIGGWKLAMEQSHFIYFYLNIIGWHEFWPTSCSDSSSIVLLILFSNYKVMIV